MSNPQSRDSIRACLCESLGISTFHGIAYRKWPRASDLRPVIAALGVLYNISSTCERLVPAPDSSYAHRWGIEIRHP